MTSPTYEISDKIAGSTLEVISLNKVRVDGATLYLYPEYAEQVQDRFLNFSDRSQKKVLFEPDKESRRSDRWIYEGNPDSENNYFEKVERPLYGEMVQKQESVTPEIGYLSLREASVNRVFSQQGNYEVGSRSISFSKPIGVANYDSGEWSVLFEWNDDLVDDDSYVKPENLDSIMNKISNQNLAYIRELGGKNNFSQLVSQTTAFSNLLVGLLYLYTKKLEDDYLKWNGVVHQDLTETGNRRIYQTNGSTVEHAFDLEFVKFLSEDQIKNMFNKENLLIIYEKTIKDIFDQFSIQDYQNAVMSSDEIDDVLHDYLKQNYLSLGFLYDSESEGHIPLQNLNGTMQIRMLRTQMLAKNKMFEQMGIDPMTLDNSNFKPGPVFEHVQELKKVRSIDQLLIR